LVRSLLYSEIEIWEQLLSGWKDFVHILSV